MAGGMGRAGWAALAGTGRDRLGLAGTPRGGG